MMSTKSRTPQDAPAPFSGAPDPENAGHSPDFILRSSDAFDFHVHKDILKFVSDCFDGMFAIPGGDGDPKAVRRHGLPVLALPEPKAVLYRLLCLAYPAESVTNYTLRNSTDLDGITSVYKAAQKYGFLRVQRLLQQMLNNQELIDAQPHRLFAIARLCGLPDVVRKAALATLTLSMDGGPPSFPEMELLTWADAHKLSEFHHECGKQAEALAKSNDGTSLCTLLSPAVLGYVLGSAMHPRLRDDKTKKPFAWWTIGAHSRECGAERTKNTAVPLPLCFTPAQWFRNYITQISMTLRLCPSPAAVKALGLLSLSKSDNAVVQSCSVCRDRAPADLANFLRQLSDDIRRSNRSIAKRTF
ncbi:hypothetical protein DFH06DRAFT_1044245 [Mycena polygramma]|nr:hypothetical protein DFH06DRAFT_1044245 [Mycena polygramma]